MLPEALPYHLKVRERLKQQASAWEFFSKAHTREEQALPFSAGLWKNASPLERETEQALYTQVDLAREKLGLGDCRVSVYETPGDAQGRPGPGEGGPEASIFFSREEAHLILSGGLRQQLSAAELQAVIAHELARVRLYTMLDGELEVADRLLTAVANFPGGSAHRISASLSPYGQTDRLFKRYTEIFCDRGAYTVLGEIDPVTACWTKRGSCTGNPTRLRALQLWKELHEAAAPGIARLVEGPWELDGLDLFSQAALQVMTRTLLEEYLRPGGFRTGPVLRLARDYFPDIAWEAEAGRAPTGRRGADGAQMEPPAGGREEAAWEMLKSSLAGAGTSVREYFIYVLLDFTGVDPTVDAFTGRATAFAAELGLADHFEAIREREGKGKEKKGQHLKKAAAAAGKTP